MITSHTENSLDFFHFSWVEGFQVKHTRLERICFYISQLYIYFDICLIGADTHLYGRVCAGKCAATVCLAGISAPFSNYSVSLFAS